MSLLDYFRVSRRSSASIAKDRLQIIVAHQRRGGGKAPDYLPQLRQDLLAVIAKYEKIDLDQVSVSVECNGDCEVLELNIVLPPPALAPQQSVAQALSPRM